MLKIRFDFSSQSESDSIFWCPSRGFEMIGAGPPFAGSLLSTPLFWPMLVISSYSYLKHTHTFKGRV